MKIVQIKLRQFCLGLTNIIQVEEEVINSNIPAFMKMFSFVQFCPVLSDFNRF